MTASRCGFVCAVLAVVVSSVLGRRVAEVPVRPHPTDPTIDEGAAPGSEVAVLRIPAKDRIVEDLVLGRPLVEAAALFRELDESFRRRSTWPSRTPTRRCG